MILSCFADDQPSLSLGELTTRCGLPRSTVHRFAEQLVAISWLERSYAGYRVGTRLFEVGSQAEQLNRLRSAAHQWMLKLHEVTRMSVHLAILEESDVLYVDKIAVRENNLPSRIGGRMPAHCTALGRAMLAYASEAEVDKVMTSGLTALTPFTATTPHAFRTRLADVADGGVAIESEESVRGYACVAAPIRGGGRAVGAISVTGPREGFDFKRLSAHVQTAANGIWGARFGKRNAGDKALQRPAPLAQRSSPAFDPWSAQVSSAD